MRSSKPLGLFRGEPSGIAVLRCGHLRNHELYGRRQSFCAGAPAAARKRMGSARRAFQSDSDRDLSVPTELQLQSSHGARQSLRQ
jgi:hypothetical protein